ncbi:ferredoxin [Actinokineospora auranticolor]|uniref:Ferredoxin n=1 Tax=Actinokineospora auranticolor TaxID=155976 RepID=A0A2S6GDE2_9PSEU|nr:ferredoxin [Actinokineospora auranticolor]PPK63264.1 hypothetical protein CLV40_13056 [Actinokineospora auranticolor]
MTQPPLTAAQRDDLVDRVARLLGSVEPGGWRAVRAELRAAGQHVEVDVVVTGVDGFTHSVRPHPEVPRLLGLLRSGMYQPGRGTWLTGSVEVDPAGAVRVAFVLDEEPRWRSVPPPVGFQDELKSFPRNDNFVPPWWRHRAGQGQAVQVEQSTSEEPRMPRVWDSLDPDGRPVARREPIATGERSALIAYLEQAPVVLAARSYDQDAFDPGREPRVPLTFHTDGTWVWPGAVAYYLREHGLPPEPGFTAHIRANRYAVPEVDEAARQRAVAEVTGG